MNGLAEQTLFAEVHLGKDAEEFLASDVGRYMLARAEEQEREAMEALASVWPWRRRRITDLQAKLWRARSFREWMSEIIVQGRQALDQLESPE